MQAVDKFADPASKLLAQVIRASHVADGGCPIIGQVLFKEFGESLSSNAIGVVTVGEKPMRRPAPAEAVDQFVGEECGFFKERGPIVIRMGILCLGSGARHELECSKSQATFDIRFPF